MLNLCTNSFYAMKDCGGVVEINLSEEILQNSGNLPDSRYCKITVKDTGTGMDKETASHIFEPFFTTKPADVGTGMGLFVVHNIVHNCGGRLDFFSEQGAGSTFVLYLPAQ